MKFLSVCSGIEAASVAWGPLGWKAIGFSEIEPFPSALLAHHYPDVPNFGDMTLLPDMIRSGLLDLPDLLCGGTPCQAFSVAGQRRSLEDERGNLSLVFCEIANAIDDERAAAGLQPGIVFWENVPGVFSTKDNAFGCFLAELAGEGVPVEPPGGKWTNAGAVLGPKRAVAWRVLDAQYFGVAQRRRRVFVVASARDDFDPATVLFEFDGMRRDSAPSRTQGQTTAGTLASRTDGGGFPGTDEACSGYVQPVGERGDGSELSGVITMAHGQGGAEIGFDRGPCLTCNHEAPIAAIPHTTHTLRGEGFDASEDGTGRGTPLVPVAHVDTMPTLRAGAPSNGPGHGARSGDSKDEYIVPVAQPIAFHPTPDPISSEDGTTHCIGTGSRQGNATVAVAVGTDCFNGGITGDVAATRGTRGSSQTASGPTVMQAMQVRRLTPRECERLQGFPDDYTNIPNKVVRDTGVGPCFKQVVTATVVAKNGTHFVATNHCDAPQNHCPRAGMPTGKGYELCKSVCKQRAHAEVNALKLAGKYAKGAVLYLEGHTYACQDCGDQATAAGVTQVVIGKPPGTAADGPRYKALGNSWAVPNVRWIGERVDMHLMGVL